MPVINTPAARQADARLEDDKQDWFKAHQIATMPSLQDRRDALEQLLLDTDPEYHKHIASRVTVIYDNLRRKAQALADQASRNYQKVFKGEQGSGAKRGITGTVRRKPKTGAAAHIASMLDSLSEGVSA